MRPTGYAYQLRTLRAIEKAQARDLTAQALEVLRIRMDTIDASDKPDDVKQRERDAAMRQWDAFMEREIPANG